MNRVRRSKEVLAELEALRLKDPKKRLRPEAVVRFAEKHPKSALGRALPNSADCVREFRLEWARGMIRVNVVVIPFDQEEIEVHPYVSLSNQRGDGYERIEVVLGNKTKRRQLLLDVLDRLEQVDELYLFPELQGIVDAIEDARKRYSRKAGKTRQVPTAPDGPRIV